MIVTKEISFSKRGLSDNFLCVSPAFLRTICFKLTSLEVSENRVNLRNFLLDSLTKWRVHVSKNLTENKTIICSLLSRHFYYSCVADETGYLASVFIVSLTRIHLSLVICVRGYTYHGDTASQNSFKIDSLR